MPCSLGLLTYPFFLLFPVQQLVARSSSAHQEEARIKFPLVAYVLHTWWIN